MCTWACLVCVLQYYLWRACVCAYVFVFQNRSCASSQPQGAVALHLAGYEKRANVAGGFVSIRRRRAFLGTPRDRPPAGALFPALSRGPASGRLDWGIVIRKIMDWSVGRGAENEGERFYKHLHSLALPLANTQINKKRCCPCAHTSACGGVTYVVRSMQTFPHAARANVLSYRITTVIFSSTFSPVCSVVGCGLRPLRPCLILPFHS